MTDGFSFSDLSALASEAAMVQLHEMDSFSGELGPIAMDDFITAKKTCHVPKI